MNSIVDDTFCIIESLGLPVSIAETSPGYEGLSVELPSGASAFFIWSKISKGDFQFRLARFWEEGSPNSEEIRENLPSAIGKIKEIIESARLS